MATKRGYYREELQRAAENLDWAITHLARVYVAYTEHHPEISDKVDELCTALSIVHDAILTVRDMI